MGGAGGYGDRPDTRADRPADRPLIAIPARFSTHASALRYAAEVAARALVEAVFRAGGEPWILHPHAPTGHPESLDADVARRLRRCDGLLLPGGGDLAPHRYTAAGSHDTVYDVDEEQDGFDLAAARYAVAAGLPTLAICRGLQVLNVALGGTLHQHIESVPGRPAAGPRDAHRHVTHLVTPEPGSRLGAVCGVPALEVSCYHHQCVDRPGAGLRVTARAADGTVEALELDRACGWLVAVQWHPEDTAARDPANQRLFDAFVAAAGARPRSPAARLAGKPV